MLRRLVSRTTKNAKSASRVLFCKAPRYFSEKAFSAEEVDSFNMWDNPEMEAALEEHLKQVSSSEVKEYRPKKAAGLLGINEITQELQRGTSTKENYAKSSSLETRQRKQSTRLVDLEKSAKKNRTSKLQRAERVATGIQSFIESQLNTVVSSPYFLTITRVNVTPDRRRATVYWSLDKMSSTFGLQSAEPHEISALNRHLNLRLKNNLRARLATHLNAKYAIELALQHDTSTNYDDEDLL